MQQLLSTSTRTFRGAGLLRQRNVCLTIIVAQLKEKYNKWNLSPGLEKMEKISYLRRRLVSVVGSFPHLVRLTFDLFCVVLIFKEVLLQLTQLFIETLYIDSGFIGLSLSVYRFSIDLAEDSNQITISFHRYHKHSFTSSRSARANEMSSLDCFMASSALN